MAGRFAPDFEGAAWSFSPRVRFDAGDGVNEALAASVGGGPRGEMLH